MPLPLPARPLSVMHEKHFASSPQFLRGAAPQLSRRRGLKPDQPSSTTAHHQNEKDERPAMPGVQRRCRRGLFCPGDAAASQADVAYFKWSDSVPGAAVADGQDRA